MDLITINVAKYYENREYYAFMPRPVFNALESAFLEGKETAEVPAAEFSKMLQAYAGK